MPSPAPSASNNYAVANDTTLDVVTVGVVLTSIATRLAALESVEATFDALIAQGTGQALAVIQANVGPELAALQAEITTAQAAIAAAQDQVGGMETSILTGTIDPAIAALQAQITAAISSLQAQITASEATIAAFAAGNFPATNVAQDPAHLFTNAAAIALDRYRAHYMGMLA